MASTGTAPSSDDTTIPRKQQAGKDSHIRRQSAPNVKPPLAPKGSPAPPTRQGSAPSPSRPGSVGASPSRPGSQTGAAPAPTPTASPDAKPTEPAGPSVRRTPKPKQRVAPNGDIAILGVAQKTGDKSKPLEKLKESLEMRGFRVLLFTPDAKDQGRTFMVVLRVEGALLRRVAPRLGMCKGPNGLYSQLDRAAVVTILQDSVRKCLEGFEHKEILLLHDEEALAEAVTDGTTNAVAQYCGTEVGLYFAWLHYYTQMLFFPAILGGALFAYQLFRHSKGATVYTPLFNIMMAVWGTLLLEGWKRENARKTFEWGVLDRPDALTKSQEKDDKGHATRDRDYSSALFLYGVSLPVLVVIILLLVRMMLYFMWMSDHYLATYPQESYMQYIPMALYSVVPPIAQAVYGQLVIYFNEWEGHTTQEAYRASLQVKQFAFHFVNSYCSLFYIAFGLNDLTRLRQMLMSLLATKQLLGNVTELAAPVVQGWVHEAMDLDAGAVATHARRGSIAGGGVEGKVERYVKEYVVSGLRAVLRHTRKVRKQDEPEKVKDDVLKAKEDLRARGLLCEDDAVLSAMEAERGFAEYEVDSEHIEILVQFGYVCMFAVAFPLAPLLALVNNIWEGKVDLCKLKVSRRPHARLVKDIGGWYTALEVMGFVAVLTNCLLLALLADQVAALVPKPLHFLLETSQGKFLLALMVEHVLLALKFLLAAIIPDVPEDIQRELDRRVRSQRENLAMSSRAHPSPRSAAMAGRVGGSMMQYASAAGGVDGASSLVPLDRLTASQLKDKMDSGTWPFNPFMMLPLLALPYVASSFGVSPFWVFPLSFCGLSYVYNMKVRQDRKTAMQLASDPRTIKAITKHLPPWYFDSNVERTVWMSQILQKMWPHVSGMTEKIVTTTVQPIIDQYRPAFINRLHITKCWLGVIAPKVTGVRYVETEEDVVRLDLDIAWAGNPEVVLEVGYKGVPLVLELSEIQFRGKVRVELNPLIPDIPGFGALLCTFMDEPHIDFSFRVGKLDVMAVGMPDMSVADVVTKIIRENVLRDFLLYPAQLVIPMVELKDLEMLRNPNPVARLRVTIVSARKLKVADLRTSDPYVKIIYKPKNQVFKTTVKPRTLNPDWGEEFWINVYDKSQPVIFKVKDHDLVGKNDPLGEAKIKIDELPDMVEVEHELTLTEVETGSLKVSVYMVPVTRPEDTLDQGDIEDDEQDDDLSLTAPEDDATRGGLESFESASEDGDRDSVNYRQQRSRGARGSVDSTDGDVTPGATPLRSQSTKLLANGLLHVEGLQLLDYQGKSSMFDPCKVYLRLQVGNTRHRTHREKNPCTDPVFTDTFDFTVERGSGVSALDVTIVESHSVSGSKAVGRIAIDLATLTRRAGKVESDWPIEYKGKVVRLHLRAFFSPMP